MAQLDDAIEAAGRTVRAQVTVTWPGGPNPIFELITDVTINQSIGDLPESVTQLAATAAAQCTLRLEAAKVTSSGETVQAWDLSPFSTSPRSVRQLAAYGVKVGVQVNEQVKLADGSWSSTPMFTGWITDYELGDDGTATLTCRDRSTSAGTTPRLPVLAADPLWSAGATKVIDPAAAVDLCLRAMNHYVLPPARTDGPLLSIPGIGSPVPELGDITTWSVTDAVYPSPWPATLDGPIAVSQYLFAQPDTPIDWSPGKRVVVEGWVFIPVGYSTAEPWWYLDGVLNVGTTTANGSLQLRVVLGGQPVYVDVPTSTVPMTAGWHYVGVSWQIGVGVTVWGDTNPAYTVANSAVVLANQIVRNLQIDRQIIGLQISQPAAAPTSLGGWVAAPAMFAFGRRITALPRTTAEQSGWQVIQDIAAAYGDVPYFDGAGKFRYLTREALRAKRYATPVRTIKSDRVLSGAPSWNEDGVRPTVTASSVTPQVRVSTVGAPAWQATEIYTIPAQQTTQFDVALDYQIRDLAPFTGGYEADAQHSWVFTVAAAAAAAGDPSAPSAGIAYVGVKAIDTGLRFTVVNRSTYPVAFWTPLAGSVPAGPYLRVHGTSIITPEPRDYTARTGATIGDPLTLPASPWRQDPTATAAWVEDIAAELSEPQVQWPSITIPLDVRLQLGDVILLQDTRYMDVPHPVQIVATAPSMPANGQHTQTLTVRSAYAPTGWILDVDGRTELDDTTVLNV